MPQLKLTRAIHLPQSWSATVLINPLEPQSKTTLEIVARSRKGEVMDSGATHWSPGAHEGIHDALVASWLEWELGLPERCALAAFTVHRQWEREVQRQAKHDR